MSLVIGGSSNISAARINGAPLMACLGDSITGRNSPNGNYQYTMNTNANVLTTGQSLAVSPFLAQLYQGLGPAQFPAAPNQLGADGYAVWASTLLNQNVQFKANYTVGMPSMTSDTIRVYGLPRILATSPAPAFCIINAGTNNLSLPSTDPASPIYSGGSSRSCAAYILNDLSTMATQLLAAGIAVIFLPIFPRSDVNFSGSLCAPVAAAAAARQVNHGLQDLAATTPGIYIADPNQFLATTTGTTSPTTISGAMDCSPECFSGDLLHPSLTGAFYMGKALAVVMSNLAPINQNFIANNSIQATGLLPINGGTSVNPYDNLLPNALFATTGGTVSAGALTNSATVFPSGSAGLPVNWSILCNDSNQTTSNIVCTTSLVQPSAAAMQGAKGSLLQMAFSGSYNKAAQPITGSTPPDTSFSNNYSGTYNNPSITNYIRFQANSSNLAYAGQGGGPGDTVEGFVYVEVPAQAITGISAITVQIVGANGSLFSQGMYPNFGQQPNCGWSGVIYCPPYQLQASDTSNVVFRIYVYFDNGKYPFTTEQASAWTLASGTTPAVNTPNQKPYAANAASPLAGVIRVGMPMLRRVY